MSDIEGYNSELHGKFYKWATLSEAVKANGFLFVSGTVGMDVDGTLPEGFRDQVRNALAQIRRTIEGAGADPSRIVQFMTFSVDTGETVFDEFRIIFDVKKEIFPDARPSGSGMRVSALAQPDIKVEIQVIVAT